MKLFHGPIFYATLALIFVTVSFVPVSEASSKYLLGKVTQILDGDTIVINSDEGKNIRVQLAYIDAPDMDTKSGETQPFHKKSRETLAKMIRGNEVIIESLGIDRFDRVEGMVFLGKININLHMVNKGMAEIYKPVRANSGQYKKHYVLLFKEAEKFAKQEKAGIWSQSNYISPYQFRRKNR